jgi:hypothetical protein
MRKNSINFDRRRRTVDSGRGPDRQPVTRLPGRGSNSCRPGMVNIWVALLGLFLIGMVALATDVAYTLLAAHQLQNAVDAAALAGAQKVRHPPACAAHGQPGQCH